MKFIFKSVLIGIIGAFAFVPLMAQDFDLSSQKGELQIVLPVPGKKVNHQGIIINPMPQQCSWNENKQLDLSSGICLRDKKGKFSNNMDFIASNMEGVKLTVDFGERISAKEGVKAVSGAYVLHIGKKGINITGYDERGAFYGIQTLKQLMESPVVAIRNCRIVESWRDFMEPLGHTRCVSL